ncbi:MAG: Ig-like domain-containing protein, partial [Massilia sp.]
GLVRTAVFTPDAGTNGGTASITIAAGSYADTAGNTGGAGATPSLHFDTLAPAAPLAHLSPLSDSGAIPFDGVTKVVTPTFDGLAEAGSTVTLYDTDGATVLGSTVATNGAWSITTSTLGEGAHTITAKASDAAGNASAASLGTQVTVDTTAPNAPSAPLPDATTTSDTTPTFTGTAAAGATIDLFDTDGTTVLGSTIADGNGAWSITVTTLGEGTHTVAAKATDLAGNTSVASAAQSVTIDTTAPAASSAPVLDAASDTGSSHSDGITAATTPTFTGTAEAGATVDLYEGGTLLGSTVATGGTWSITSSALGAGQHTVSTIVTDAAGNASGASTGLTFTVDLTAPTTTIGGIAFSADHGASGADFITDTAAQTISGTLSAALQTGEQVEVSLDNGASWTAAQVNGTTWSLAATLAGSGTMQVRVVDAVDNAGPVASQAYVLDTAAPTVAITSDTAALKIGETVTITFTFSEDPGASFTWDGAQGDVTVGGGTLSALSGSGLVRTAVFTPDAGTNGGTASITIAAGSYADTAGNTGGAGATPSLHFDTLAPNAPSAPQLATSSDVTRDATPTLTGTAEAGATVTVYDTDGATVLGSTVATNGAWSIDATTLGEGAHTVTARATDAAGNAGAVSSGATFTVDTTAPTVTIGSDASALKMGETATVTFTFSEDPGTSFTWDGTHGDLVVSGGTLGALSGTGLVRTATFTPDAHVNGGTASITIAAGSYADAAGNTGGAGATPSLHFDTLAPNAPDAPQLVAASDTGTSSADGVTRVTTPTVTGTGEAHAAVTLYDGAGTTVLGTATADANGAWTITSAALADGSHALRVTETDAAGNVSTRGAALTVTVDTHAPATAAAPVLASASDSGTAGDRITKVNTPTFNGTAEALAQVTLYDTDGQTVLGSARADADGKWSIVASTLADGVHVLAIKQVDAAGNASAASPALTVTVDTTAPAAPATPQLQAQSDTDTVGDGITYAVPVLEGTAAANDLVTLYDGTTAVGTTHADAHGHWSIAAQTLGLGRHTLSVTDTDAAGNVSAASGSFALTVEEAPVPLVDGVRVVTVPVVLPDGASGSQVQIPIVGAGRVEETGAAGTADIPLSSDTGLLVAHVGVGYGLTASGGANTTVANGGADLIAAIQAATMSSGDQVYMSGNGQSFLAQLGASQSLLVQTIAPVSSQGALDGVLTLSAGSNAQQHVALVIQTGGLAPGGTIALQNVDFAAIVGAANIVVQGGSQMLTGDAASQHFTLTSGGNTQVFSGGGDDTIGFGAPPAQTASASGAAHANAAATPTTTMLHGGAGSDTATFAGARADFDVETHNGYLVVSSKAAPEAKALVVNVEQLQFSDATVKVEDSGAMDTLAGIYETALGRQADLSGIGFWADAHQAGVSWGRIALDIIGSPDYAASHETFNGNAEHDIAILYKALFDRAPDAPGLAFWTEGMRNGVSLEHIAMELVESVEMIGHQRAATGWDFTV